MTFIEFQFFSIFFLFKKFRSRTKNCYILWIDIKILEIKKSVMKILQFDFLAINIASLMRWEHKILWLLFLIFSVNIVVATSKLKTLYDFFIMFIEIFSHYILQHSKFYIHKQMNLRWFHEIYCDVQLIILNLFYLGTIL